MSVALDASDLGHVAVSLFDGFVVFELLALSGGFDAFAFGGVGAPEADVAIVGAGEDEVCV